MLVAVAAGKGGPGVTTASVALAATWPRPVLLAECDPSGGDLACRLRAASGGRLDPGCGLLSLAVASRREFAPGQVWAHTQKVSGGLDLLAGVITPEQGARLRPLWEPLGAAFAALPEADVIADCGRIGADGPRYDLFRSAHAVVLVTRATLAEVVRVRERITVLRAAFTARGQPDCPVRVVVVAPRRRFHEDLGQVRQILGKQVIGGLAHEPGSMGMLDGQWGARLGRSLLIRTAGELAGRLAAVPEGEGPAHAAPAGSG